MKLCEENGNWIVLTFLSTNVVIYEVISLIFFSLCLHFNFQLFFFSTSRYNNFSVRFILLIRYAGDYLLNVSHSSFITDFFFISRISAK